MKVVWSDSTKTAYSFNIPAATTCPGKTKTCFVKCYGLKGRLRPGMNGSITTDKNIAVLTEDVTAIERIAWPKSKDINDFRLMGVGDLYSIEFGRSVFNMCEINSDKGFWMYTRSFEILTKLLGERKIPDNLVLFVSADIDNVAEAEAMAAKYDLPVAYMGDDVAPEKDAFVCPTTAGDPRFRLSKIKTEAPCIKCKYCFNRKEKFVAYRTKKGVRFFYH